MNTVVRPGAFPLITTCERPIATTPAIRSSPTAMRVKPGTVTVVECPVSTVRYVTACAETDDALDRAIAISANAHAARFPRRRLKRGFTHVAYQIAFHVVQR